VSANPQPLQNYEYFWRADEKGKYQGGTLLHYLHCHNNATPDARESGLADKGESFKPLGITLDPLLNWKAHIDELLKMFLLTSIYSKCCHQIIGEVTQKL